MDALTQTRPEVATREETAAKPERNVTASNALFATINGVCTQLGMNLTHASMVLSVFIRTLGGSNTLIGLLPAIRFGGWFTPQFLVATWVGTRPRKVPVVVAMEVARIVVYGTIALLTYTLGAARPGLLLLLFFVLFSFSRLTAGTGALARMDTLGKIVPPTGRASFFANRNFWAGAFAFGAGFLVRALLGETTGWPFPGNFALLFGLSCAAFVVAALGFSRVQEAPNGTSPPQHSIKAQLARAPGLLCQDPDFRRYLAIRVLLNMTRISAPFYPVFALDILGAPPSMVGFYLSAMTLAGILSNLLWRRAGHRRGPLHLLHTSGLLTTLTPLIAAALPWAMRSFGFTVERYGLLPAYLFAIVFLFAGASDSGLSIGMMALALDIAPEEERASYIGLTNTVLGFVSFAPILAGAVIDQVGFQPIFVLATALLFIGYLMALRWKFQAS